MQSVQIGDRVQFFYNGKSRTGTVENQWPERHKGFRTEYRAAGFCVDHGDYYKSYQRNKVSFLAKQS